VSWTNCCSAWPHANRAALTAPGIAGQRSDLTGQEPDEALEVSIAVGGLYRDVGGAGRYGTGRPLPEGTRIAGIGASHRLSETNLRIADTVNEIAADRGVSAAQVAIAWVRTQQAKSVIIPIVGARTPRSSRTTSAHSTCRCPQPRWTGWMRSAESNSASRTTSPARP
jgi:hypothetical protein